MALCVGHAVHRLDVVSILKVKLAHLCLRNIREDIDKAFLLRITYKIDCFQSQELRLIPLLFVKRNSYDFSRSFAYC